MRRILLGILFMLSTTIVSAREPLYVVNGTVVDNIDSIEQANIAKIDVLPASEETIAQWGIAASEGVILVTLIYDTPAKFNAEGYDNFTDYLMHTVKWGKDMPAERVSLRIIVDSSGKATISKILQSTSRQFLKRVERAIALSPQWTAATKNGVNVESTQLVNLLMPEGKSLPIEQGVIIL